MLSKVKLILISYLIFSCSNVLSNSDILGAGATLPLPLINVLISDFEKEQSLTIEYQAVGSSEGIRRITSRAVDFGLTDIGLTESELLHDDLLQYPLVISGVVVVVNLPLVNQSVLLNPTTLSQIMLGKITEWDDPQIKLLNPTINLPSIPIIVIHRKEGSGTTFTFTNYLSKVSSDWDSEYGVGSQISWPIGIGVLGNDGAAQAVKSTIGSISYIEYSYAKEYQLKMISLQNYENEFVNPSLISFRSALNHAKWKRNSFYESLVNLPGKESWPIVGVSYLLIHQLNNDAKDVKETIKFLNYAYTKGETSAKEKGYLLVDDEEVMKRIRSSWLKLRDSKGFYVFKP
jgi:phosphate transport system substrate-binding protein